MLSHRLDWRHIDLDAEIERFAGATVEEIFATQGETAFRAMEAELTPGILAREEVVLSPGGGWITNPGLLDALPDATLTVWLRVSPEEVLRRLALAPGQPVRPLLQAEDPKARIRTLLAAREALYARATLAIDTDRRTPEAVTAEVEAFIRGVVAPRTE